MEQNKGRDAVALTRVLGPHKSFQGYWLGEGGTVPFRMASPFFTVAACFMDFGDATMLQGSASSSSIWRPVSEEEVEEDPAANLVVSTPGMLL